MSDKFNKKAVLVSIASNSSLLEECERSIDELERLLNTSGAECFAKVIQIKEKFDPRTCLGKGKVEEIKDICKANEIPLVVFDFDLSPAQIRNLENDIGDVTVIDRSMLILDIFALHAISREGKLQVELAQLKYSAPRLTGKGIELSRQGGGIGSRGPGESKLETDRRHLHEKINSLEKKLAELEHNRSVMRAQRDRSGLPKIALVGYTNAGKSTLLNKLTGASVLAEDKLFATLDPTTRKMELKTGEYILITDTVGFIRKLPHNLVKAFKSTLDEVVYADILLVVADINDPELGEHLEVTRNVIDELGASDKPVIYVYNKSDIMSDTSISVATENAVSVSAIDGRGIDLLLDMIADEISKGKSECTLFIPYSDQTKINQLYKDYNVISVDYLDKYVKVSVVLDQKGRGQYSEYMKEG